MKNITLSAAESVVDAARARARAEGTTVNEQFRLWLTSYARQQDGADFENAMQALRGQLVLGRKLSRDELNER